MKNLTSGLAETASEKDPPIIPDTIPTGCDSTQFNAWYPKRSSPCISPPTNLFPPERSGYKLVISLTKHPRNNVRATGAAADPIQ
jgi:hypothetical protein